MLKTLALAALGSLAFAATAHGQNMKATHEFLMQAGASDKYEIAAATLAESKSTNPRVQEFARMMVRDHTDSTAKLTTAGETDMGHKLMAPMIMAPQQKMLDALNAASDRTFDRTYMDQQEKAHEMALDLMKGYAANGDYPLTKAAAGEIAGMVQQHLAMVRDIRDHLK